MSADTGASAALDRTLAALADPHRRRVVELLGERARPAGELARLVGLSPPAMSRHLRTLRESGLVRESHAEFDARVRIYELEPGPMRTLRTWLERSERLWTEQLQAFKAFVERTDVDQADAEPADAERADAERADAERAERSGP